MKGDVLRNVVWLLTLCLAVASVDALASEVWPVATPEAVHAFVESGRRHLKAGETPTIWGVDDWLFSRTEVRHMTVGPFWGDAALAVSTAENEPWRDPVPAIVQFNDELKGLGVELLLLPVPPKAVIYADKLSDAVAPDAAGRLPRVDAQHRKFYALLRQQGVEVMDIAPRMLELRRAGANGAARQEANCRTDTHWSPAAIEAVAGKLAEWIAGRPWHDALGPRAEYASRRADLTITGDLTAFLPDAARPDRETFTAVRFVGRAENPRLPVEPSLESPVLLLGDSHVLVFSIGGDMHSTGAGLPDQLAFELGMPIDLLGKMGSGATPTRVDLFRRAREPGYIEGKRLVIWCFRGMEFTENPGGWRPLPVQR